MAGEWKDAEPGERLLTARSPAGAIYIPIPGDLEI
jgi:hypothetical protein